MNRVGRATKLTGAVHQMIVNAVSCGVPLVTAAHYAGVDKATILEWIARGEGRHRRASTTPYADFAEALKKARAQDEVRRIARLEKAARGGDVVYEKTTTYPDGRVVREVKLTEPQWTPDAWFLERSYPDRWGRKASVDMRVTISAAVARVAEQLGVTPEEVLAEANALLAEVDHERP